MIEINFHLLFFYNWCVRFAVLSRTDSCMYPITKRPEMQENRKCFVSRDLLLLLLARRCSDRSKRSREPNNPRQGLTWVTARQSTSQEHVTHMNQMHCKTDVAQGFPHPHTRCSSSSSRAVRTCMHVGNRAERRASTAKTKTVKSHEASDGARTRDLGIKSPTQ